MFSIAELSSSAINTINKVAIRIINSSLVLAIKYARGAKKIEA
tara:strand:+ start:219 stop:347 length:129 start_codon:yes stop_codon:yes gene_type:complete